MLINFYVCATSHQSLCSNWLNILPSPTVRKINTGTPFLVGITDRKQGPKHFSPYKLEIFHSLSASGLGCLIL